MPGSLFPRPPSAPLCPLASIGRGKSVPGTEVHRARAPPNAARSPQTSRPWTLAAWSCQQLPARKPPRESPRTSPHANPHAQPSSRTPAHSLPRDRPASAPRPSPRRSIRVGTADSALSRTSAEPLEVHRAHAPPNAARSPQASRPWTLAVWSCQQLPARKPPRESPRTSLLANPHAQPSSRTPAHSLPRERPASAPHPSPRRSIHVGTADSALSRTSAEPLDRQPARGHAGRQDQLQSGSLARPPRG